MVSSNYLRIAINSILCQPSPSHTRNPLHLHYHPPLRFERKSHNISLFFPALLYTEPPFVTEEVFVTEAASSHLCSQRLLHFVRSSDWYFLPLASNQSPLSAPLLAVVIPKALQLWVHDQDYEVGLVPWTLPNQTIIIEAMLVLSFGFDCSLSVQPTVLFSKKVFPVSSKKYHSTWTQYGDFATFFHTDLLPCSVKQLGCFIGVPLLSTSIASLLTVLGLLAQLLIL